MVGAGVNCLNYLGGNPAGAASALKVETPERRGRASTRPRRGRRTRGVFTPEACPPEQALARRALDPVPDAGLERRRLLAFEHPPVLDQPRRCPHQQFAGVDHLAVLHQPTGRADRVDPVAAGQGAHLVEPLDELALARRRRRAGRCRCASGLPAGAARPRRTRRASTRTRPRPQRGRRRSLSCSGGTAPGAAGRWRPRTRARSRAPSPRGRHWRPGRWRAGHVRHRWTWRLTGSAEAPV